MRSGGSTLIPIASDEPTPALVCLPDPVMVLPRQAGDAVTNPRRRRHPIRRSIAVPSLRARSIYEAGDDRPVAGQLFNGFNADSLQSVADCRALQGVLRFLMHRDSGCFPTSPSRYSSLSLSDPLHVNPSLVVKAP